MVRRCLQDIKDDGSRGCFALLLQTSPWLALPALTETWWWLRFKGPRVEATLISKIWRNHVI